MTAPQVVETLTYVCELRQLVPELGKAALIGERQVAIFLLDDGRVFAVDNRCPFSGAYVISRGITGSRGDVPTIASPMYKQVFSLLTGECLAAMDKEPKPGLSPDLETFPVTVHNGQVFVDLRDSS